MIPALTERKKADRIRMGEILHSLAVTHGATCEVEEFGEGRQHSVRLHIVAPGGLQCRLSFEGDSTQPDVHVIGWCSWDRRLALDFGPSVNPHHGAKSTHVAAGFPALLADIGRGLARAADGSAYVTPEVAP